MSTGTAAFGLPVPQSTLMPAGRASEKTGDPERVVLLKYCAVQPLPITALGVDAGKVTALARAGLRRIADLACRPRAPLAARFGQDLLDRLARVLGEADHPVSPRRPVPELMAEIRFADPIGRSEDVMAALGDLAQQLAAKLEARGAGALLDSAEPPTAIICDDDILAGGVYLAARERGLRIPEDMSVVGFDDIPLVRVLSPGLTTVAADARRLGAVAFEMLASVMAGEEAGGRTLPVELVVRESTAPPRR